MQNIEILILITELGIGGAQKLVAQTAEGLNRNKYEITVACLYQAGYWAKWLESHGISVLDLKMRSKFDFHVLTRLASHVRSKEIRLINTHLFHANLVGTMIGKRVDVPVIISTRHSDEIGGRRREIINRLTVPFRDHTIAISDSVMRTELKRSGVNPLKISTITNGIDTNEFLKSDEHLIASIRNEFDLSNDDIVIVYIGRIVPEKGLAFLLNAVRLLKPKCYDTKVLIIGGGTAESEVQSMVAKNNLQDSVILGGIRTEISEILSIGDIFVLPSLWEGLPLGLIEAMAAAKPVIATAVGGVPEIVINEKTGLLVPPADSESLAEAILTLLKDPARARQMGEAGRNRAIEHFDIKRTIQQTEALYDSLLRKKLGIEYSQEIGWHSLQGVQATR